MCVGIDFIYSIFWLTSFFMDKKYQDFFEFQFCDKLA